MATHMNADKALHWWSKVSDGSEDSESEVDESEESEQCESETESNSESASEDSDDETAAGHSTDLSQSTWKEMPAGRYSSGTL